MSEFSFTTTLEAPLESIGMHVLLVPKEISDALPENNRMLLTVNGVEFRRSLQARRTPDPYVIFGKDCQK
ncbi:MAG: hypothetical protein AAF226_18020, partial [Verrucomicrobiota bacterium]